MEQLVLTASFLVPLILSAVLFYNARNNRPKIILAISMLNASAVFIANNFYFLEDFYIYTYLHSLHVALVLFIYPSIYLYLIDLTGKLKSLKKTWIHFLPGITFFVAYIMFFDLRFNYNERVSFLSTYREGIIDDARFQFVEWIRLINVATIVIQVVGYSFAMFTESRRYNLRLRYEFSNADHLQIKWLSWFNSALIIIAIVSVIFYVINPFSDQNNTFLILSMFAISVFVWLIGIWGNAQPKIVLPTERKPSLESQNGIDNIYRQLESLMLEKKYYLKPDLTLTEISKLAGTNRSYTSQAINTHGKSNFSTFVNKYRIEEAKTIMREKPGIKLEQVAFESGFGSVLSMQRAFTRQTGLSPGKWRTSIQ
ncbi:MAG: helix-turn-helix domain-containing protein [Prolixibacteraceae bacterium]|jgi:AraC-like DNA-binding protein|nr:helix-turn-helix domain-containing protein [Prolixibacteraceae bacterium]